MSTPPPSEPRRPARGGRPADMPGTRGPAPRPDPEPGVTRRPIRSGDGVLAPRKLKTAEREAAALNARKAGATFQQIADQLGYSTANGAWKAVQRGMKRIVQAPADEVRTLEVERLDALQLGLWKAAVGGDTKAVETVLKIMERRAALLGLDQPREVRVKLEAGQVEFLESTIRGFIDGIFSALATTGHEAAAAAIHETVFGEVIPDTLARAAAGPTGRGAIIAAGSR